MKIRNLIAAALVASAATLGSSPAWARASFDIDFGANVPLGDDARLFFSISSRYFDRDVRVVEEYYGRYRNPDDLAVSLFLCARSGQSPDFILSLRKQGLGWFEIGSRVRVPYDAWFVPVQRDPGPPYGKAYGYWKKHRRNPKSAVALSDGEIRNLVAVRMASEYYGVPAERAMEWQSTNRGVQGVMTHEYRSRYGKNARPKSGSQNDDGEGQGNGHGKGKSKHEDKGHDRD